MSIVLNNVLVRSPNEVFVASNTTPWYNLNLFTICFEMTSLIVFICTRLIHKKWVVLGFSSYRQCKCNLNVWLMISLLWAYPFPTVGIFICHGIYFRIIFVWIWISLTPFFLFAKSHTKSLKEIEREQERGAMNAL